jgi:hypothetical protein
MTNKLKQFWLWLQPRREPTAFYPDEEPKTRGERTFEMVGEGKHPADEFPSSQWGRQNPF